MAKKLETISLKDITPSSIAADQQIAAMNTALDSLLWSTTGEARLVLLLARIDELSSDMLDMLAWQYHVDIYEPEALPIEQKRALVKNALLVHRYKGTRWAIRQTLLDLGFKDIKFTEWWEMGTAPHTFALKVYPLNEDIMPKVRSAVYAMKPVRSEMTGLTVRLIHEEKLTAAEAASVRRQKILSEAYPWTEISYGGLDAALKYFAASDKKAAKYSIYEKAERISHKVRVCFIEQMFAMHKYGDNAAPYLYYDGSVSYSTENELNETFSFRSTKQTAHGDVLETEEFSKFSVKWIMK